MSALVNPGQGSAYAVTRKNIKISKEQTIEAVIKAIQAHETYFDTVVVHNNTRGVKVCVTVANKQMHITITNEEEDAKFRFT